MEPVSQNNNEIMLSVIKEQYGKLVYTYTTHLKEAHNLNKWNEFFKWADIVLSAITTGGLLGLLFTDSRICEIAGCLASVVLLVISLYTKEARLAEASVEHKVFANKLWIVRERYLSFMAEFDTLEKCEIVKQRDSLQEQLAALYENEPLTTQKSYRQAQNALQSEEEQYFSKEELNRMLPACLRKE